MFTYYEFFAGGGMARAGLGSRWNCAFANDCDELKAETYRRNFGDAELVVGDVHQLKSRDLPGQADLAWASFPCQDLSCAGNGLGIGSESGSLRTRSGTFWPFIALMRDLRAVHRAPKLIVLENVAGLLTGNGGADFLAVASALSKLDYNFCALVIDARHFVPQSRPRVFVVAADKSLSFPSEIVASGPVQPWHPEMVVRAHTGLPPRVARNWIWLDPGKVKGTQRRLTDIVSGSSGEWHSKAETDRLISMMAPAHRRKLREAKASSKRMVATLFLRMRPEKGRNKQRAEISFDDVAGCIRTPKGGGSRVRVLCVKGGQVRTRLLAPREAAALMGLRKGYKLPERYDAAFKVLGDGVAAPAVAFVRKRLLEPMLRANPRPRRRAKRRNGR